MSEETSEKETEMDKTPGVISWNELMTRDTAASAKFYETLLGWKSETMDMDGFAYTIFKAGERSVAGMSTLPPEAANAPVMWTGYVTVEDLSAAIAKARELGAKILKDTVTFPMGSFAIIQDPQGAVIGLWQFAA
jgi:uncharacterized protein